MIQHASERFHRLSEEKKNTILAAAVKEFAERGFENANTNRIAHAAGISVGSLFQYFENKKNLFLHIVDIGADKIASYLESVVASDSTLREKIRTILYLVIKTSREERDYLRIYQELSAIGNKEMISPIALRLESYTAKAYEQLLSEGVRSGEVRPELNIRLAAFQLDNVLFALQHAYAGDYFKERFGIYVSETIHEPDYDDFVVEETMKFLSGALLTPEKPRKEP